jgi:predicted nucleic-acid-binding protein
VVAIDTNILVRFLIEDDLDQADRVQALLEGHDVLLVSTVLLESEWVLRGVYGVPRSQVVEKLRAFTRLPRVFLQEPARVAAALAWAEAGMDFADALHLSSAEGCEAFISFDKRLAKTAEALAPIPVRQP